MTSGVGCYASANLHADVDVTAATGGEPTALCAQDWTSGPLHARLAAGAPVPSLTACVLPQGGAVGVFPETTCQALGLEPLPPDYTARAKQFAALRDDLRDRFAAQTCLPVTEGVQIVREALARHGFARWTVTSGQDGPGTPCAAFSPDSEHHNITVVGQVSPAFVATIEEALTKVNGTCHAGTSPADTATASNAVSRATRPRLRNLDRPRQRRHHTAAALL